MASKHDLPSGVERHITETKFWDELCHDVFGPRKGGAIIFVDSENARKGTAKTSGAAAVARFVAHQFDYRLTREDGTLSGAKYLRRYQEHPGEDQPSVLVLDEIVGGGSGDARRAMSHQNVDFGRAWQLLRTKRVVTFATLPDWNEADPRLQKYADYRLWMRERPIGYFQPYKVTTPFNATAGTKVKLKGLSYGDSPPRVKFPNMDAHGDWFYHFLSDQKDQLIHSNTWDADKMLGEDGESQDGELIDPDEAERRSAIKYAIRLYRPWDEDNDTTYADVAKVIDGYEKSWVGNRIKEWRDGEHRELVEEPDT